MTIHDRIPATDATAHVQTLTAAGYSHSHIAFATYPHQPIPGLNPLRSLSPHRSCRFGPSGPSFALLNPHWDISRIVSDLSARIVLRLEH